MLSLSHRPATPLLALSIVAAAAMLSACSKKEAAPEPVRAVKLVTVGEGQIESAQQYSGDVRARVESRLGFRVAGKITRREVELGQHVKAGQVLARLDARDYQLSADAARAQLASATTQRDLAEANAKRFRTLRAQNFISAAEMERREASLKAAQATLDRPRRRQRRRATSPATPACWPMRLAWSPRWRPSLARSLRRAPPWCA